MQKGLRYITEALRLSAFNKTTTQTDTRNKKHKEKEIKMETEVNKYGFNIRKNLKVRQTEKIELR